ncbi:glycosyltransferase [candidate division WWE3 bacterium]|nr:glycosyltransferase [candidate division WWE3 bacterium]
MKNTSDASTNTNKKPKIAIVHDYLLQYGGAEKTLEAILELFPNAPIYTGLYAPKNLPETITKRKVYSLKNPLVRAFSKHFTFIMPMIFENFDLTKYDIVISDSSAWAKGVITQPDQLHISYIHTPPRFLYKYSVESPKRFKWYYKPIVAVLDHFLRIWDYCAGQRPDYLLTNSQTTAARINKFYGREARVVHPPVEADLAKTTATEQEKNATKPAKAMQAPYFCSLGRLAAYKNTHLLVQAFNLLGWDLIVMGTGPEERKLKKLAQNNPKIKITGRVTEEQKNQILAGCKGLIFPVVEEDWGIVPLEAMSHGKPVLAHKSGGATETVKAGVTGMFFESLELEDFINSIKIFNQNIEEDLYKEEKIKQSVGNFSKETFKQEFLEFVKEKYRLHKEENQI